MSRLTSGERRGSIFLIIIGAIIILAMTLSRGYFKRDAAQMPAVVGLDSVSSEKAAAKSLQAVKSAKPEKSDSLRRSRKSSKPKSPRKESQSGRERDFLSEPVRTK